MLVLLAVEAGAVKEGSGSLPSSRVPLRRVSSRWILGRAVKVGVGSLGRREGFPVASTNGGSRP